MTFRAARVTPSDARRSPPELRATLDAIADEILERLEGVMAKRERERHGGATVIISGDAPVGSRRDAHGWATRIADVASIVDPRRPR